MNVFKNSNLKKKQIEKKCGEFFASDVLLVLLVFLFTLLNRLLNTLILVES